MEERRWRELLREGVDQSRGREEALRARVLLTWEKMAFKEDF